MVDGGLPRAKAQLANLGNVDLVRDTVGVAWNTHRAPRSNLHDSGRRRDGLVSDARPTSPSGHSVGGWCRTRYDIAFTGSVLKMFMIDVKQKLQTHID